MVTGQVHVQRTCVARLAEAATDAGLLIVGVPGAGKSGAIHDVGTMLREANADVALLSVDQLAGFSQAEITAQLSLNRYSKARGAKILIRT
jgi:putative protein kinase ArgK-like GTPase of G3E family